MKLYKDKEWLYEEYIVKNRTQSDIASDFGVDRKSVDYFLTKFDIHKPKNSYSLPSIKVFCSNCGNEHEKSHKYYQRRIKTNNPRFFCSNECANAAHSQLMTGENNPNFEGTWNGTPNDILWTSEQRSEMAKSYIQRLKDEGTFDERMKALHEGHQRFFSTEEGKQKRREIGAISVVAQSGKRTTNIEKKVQDFLDTLEIEFQPQVKISYYVVDFYIPSKNIVIEAQGDYWHGNPKRFPTLNKTQKENVRRDKAKRTYLLNHGYTFLSFWETDINDNFDFVTDMILSTINK